jgi:hypothetical protein
MTFHGFKMENKTENWCHGFFQAQLWFYMKDLWKPSETWVKVADFESWFEWGTSQLPIRQILRCTKQQASRTSRHCDLGRAFRSRSDSPLDKQDIYVFIWMSWPAIPRGLYSCVFPAVWLASGKYGRHLVLLFVPNVKYHHISCEFEIVRY